MHHLFSTLLLVVTCWIFAIYPAHSSEPVAAIIEPKLESEYIDIFGKVTIVFNSNQTITFVRQSCGTFEAWLNGNCKDMQVEEIKTKLSILYGVNKVSVLKFDKKPEYRLEIVEGNPGADAYFKIVLADGKTTRILTLRNTLHIREVETSKAAD